MLCLNTCTHMNCGYMNKTFTRIKKLKFLVWMEKRLQDLNTKNLLAFGGGRVIFLFVVW